MFYFCFSQLIYFLVFLFAVRASFGAETDILSSSDPPKDDEVNSAPKDKYNILAVMLCYRGHFNPGSGIIRSLTERKHNVTLLTTNMCSELVEQFAPNVAALHELQVIPEHDFSTNVVAQFWKIHYIMHANGTVLLYHAVDDFLKSSEVVFDGMFIDLVANGAAIAAKKHKIPVVTQFMGPIMEPYSEKPLYFDRHEIPTETPWEKPSLLMALMSAFFSGVYDLAISYPIYRSVNLIHAENGWDKVDYNNGLWPFSYTQQFSMYIAHGAQPIIHPNGFKMENVISIGFVPDKLMYSELTRELTDFIEQADGPVIFISMGTVFMKNADELIKFYEQLKNQRNFYFIWAVKTAMIEDLGITTEPVSSERLFVGRYLPQGKILQHSKVKLFVTHCGSNSVQDSVYAMKPMITHPGFGDQVYLSNIILKYGLGKYMVNFDYGNMESLIIELLEDSKYTQMKEKLRVYRDNQIALGGFTKGAEVIEDVISGRLKINTNVKPEQLFGIHLFGIRATVFGVLAVVLGFFCLGVIAALKLSKFMVKTFSGNRKPHSKQAKKD